MLPRRRKKMTKNKKHKISYEVRKGDKNSWKIYVTGTDCVVASSKMKKTAQRYCDRMNENLSSLD